MKVQALLLVLLVPCFAWAEQQYYGTRISNITLSGPDSQADLQLIPVRIGDTLTQENIRASIQALYDTGRYSTIEVDATPDSSGGTALVFRVRPYFFFSTFVLEQPDLLERPLSTYFRLPLGERFNASTVDRIAHDTADLLKSQGYFEATVTPETELDETTRLATITLRVDPGVKAKVGNVRIKGGEQTFPPRELLKELHLGPGADFSGAQIDEGATKIRSKFTDLGFLNTRVNIDRTYIPSSHTVDLDVTVQPGQFTLVETRGYDISKKKVREMVPVFEEGAVDQDLVEEGRAGIERYMQQEGYFEAKTSSEIITAPLDNAIQINYNIETGAQHHIRSLTISGNEFFHTEEIRSRLKIRTSKLFSHGVFSPDLLDEDIRTIQAMYRDAGFEDVIVKGSYDEQDHAFDIVIQIQEGTRLPLEMITFSGNSALSDADIRRELRLKEGDVYTRVAVDQARAQITGMYYSRGYADVRVEPDAERIEANHGMRVTFAITEGESYRIGNILVSGNSLTKEKIIHRNSRLFPNTPYNPEAILEAQQRLYATGLFNRVEIVTIEQNLSGVRNLLIQVEDAKPIQLTYGIGFQEYERARGTLDISHNNLWGLDRSLSARIRASQRERLAQSTFREPRLFNHDLDGFASAFAEYTQRPFFTANRIDFSLQVLKRFTPQHNFLVTADWQTVNLGDIRVNPHAERGPQEPGVCQICQIGRIGASFIRDHRNNPANATTGTFNTTTYQVAARPFGSELNFTSLFHQTSTYYPLSTGVLASSIRLGWNHPFAGTGLLPQTERYYAGGATTLRGFGLDEAQPAGGNVLIIGNVEYRVPLRTFPVSGVSGALFYDTGNVFQTLSDVHLSGITHTAGFGLRYGTPVGPVRLDVGINLDPTTIDGQKEARVHVFFTLGNPF